MDLKTLKQSFSQLPQIDATATQLQNSGTHIQWKGLVGSSKSICAAVLAEQTTGHHLFILPDKEQAAYFLNDLEELYPEDKRILFYPASYRVPYQLEETDNANVVARAEVLEKINTGKNGWIVTYPEALFEKVPTKKNLSKNTLRVDVGKTYSIDFINELLLEYHFERVDFVYEPGQFSIRGGIVDVYSYSNEHPYRIEFFGDEVESIRTFEASTQLSITNFTFFNVIPNVQGQLNLEGNGTFFEFLGQQAVLWVSSFDQLTTVLEKEYDKAVQIYTDLSDTVKRTLPSDLFLHPTEAKSTLEAYSCIEDRKSVV